MRNPSTTLVHMNPRSAPFPIQDWLRAAHTEGPLGRVGLPFATPVFFEDPPTPTPPAGDPLAQLAAEIERVRSGAATAAEQAATEAAMKALGFATLDEATTKVAAWRKAELDAMSEADRIKAEAVAAQAQADQEKAAAAAERHRLSITERLVLAADLPAARRDAVRAQLNLQPGATPEQIDAEVDRVRKDPALSVLFTPLADPDPSNPNPNPAPSSTVPGVPPRPAPPKLGGDVKSIVEGITSRTGIK